MHFHFRVPSSSSFSFLLCSLFSNLSAAISLFFSQTYTPHHSCYSTSPTQEGSYQGRGQGFAKINKSKAIKMQASERSSKRASHKQAASKQATSKPQASKPQATSKQATSKPQASHKQATSKPQASHKQATSKPQASHKQATSKSQASKHASKQRASQPVSQPASQPSPRCNTSRKHLSCPQKQEQEHSHPGRKKLLTGYQHATNPAKGDGWARLLHPLPPL